MRNVANALLGLGVLTLGVLLAFGLDPKSTADLAPRIAFGVAGGAVVLGLFLHVAVMVVVDGRRVEATGIDLTAEPIREFGYRWLRAQTAMVAVFAALLMAPLLVVVPILVARHARAGHEPAVLVMSAVFFLVGLFLALLTSRGWTARVWVYPDRLAVRGMRSNGSLRWDEATAFRVVREQTAKHHWMWVYFLDGGSRSLRVEGTVESPQAFVREVEARTGLTLEKVPRTAQ